MAVKQRKAPAEEPETKDIPSSANEDAQEQEYHTEPSDDEDEAAEPQPEEYHTDPEDASDAENDIPLLPTALLKSKPSTPAAHIDWDSMTQKEKKALRNELGVSMKELRDEARKNGVIDAGYMAQIKRGVRPAEKVAGGRVVKRKRRKTPKPEKAQMSGRQKLVEQRGRDAKRRKR